MTTTTRPATTSTRGRRWHPRAGRSSRRARSSGATRRWPGPPSASRLCSLSATRAWACAAMTRLILHRAILSAAVLSALAQTSSQSSSAPLRGPWARTPRTSRTPARRRRRPSTCCCTSPPPSVAPATRPTAPRATQRPARAKGLGPRSGCALYAPPPSSRRLGSSLPRGVGTWPSPHPTTARPTRRRRCLLSRGGCASSPSCRRCGCRTRASSPRAAWRAESASTPSSRRSSATTSDSTTRPRAPGCSRWRRPSCSRRTTTGRTTKRTPSSAIDTSAPGAASWRSWCASANGAVCSPSAGASQPGAGSSRPWQRPSTCRFAPSSKRLRTSSVLRPLRPATRRGRCRCRCSGTSYPWPAPCRTS
mmetsp:Transcript_32802/g.110546  ORF Transcript_32802/g.110546 Transcript_32802/m.110546 type:complete len:364 (+) Transcript_32802:3998-5089(+)